MSFRQNVRYAVRLMGKKPFFTAAIVLTLGVCVGAVTAVFSIVDATLLRPLPYPDPERLAIVMTRFYSDRGDGLQEGQDGAAWEHFRNLPKTVDLAVYSDSYRGLNFSSGDQVGYINQQRVGSDFFRVFGISPMIGREFTPEEDVQNGPAVVILSHALWLRAFHADASVVGRTATIAGQVYEVIGVAAPHFESTADLWTPLRPSRTGEGAGINYVVAARVHPGVSWEQAEAEIRSIGEALVQQRRLRPGSTMQYGLMTLQKLRTGSLESSMWMAFAAAVLVLLIGCVNIAGMLMARGAARTSEIATRMALGAHRSTVVKQLLSESLTLSVVGGALGIVLGYVSLDAMKSILPGAYSSLRNATLDVRVLAAMAGISALTSILFGLFPALQAGRVDIRTAQAGRGVAGASGSWTRRALSTAQIAIAVAMLIGAGLLIRSFDYLAGMDPGFDSTNVTIAGFAMRDARYSSSAQVDRYFRETVTRLQQLPGVEAAAVAQSLPYERGRNTVFDRPGDDPNVSVRLTNISYVTPQFFHAFRIPILRGRGITDADGPDSTPVMVVNQAFADMHFKDGDPIGAQVTFRFGEGTRQIVGIVGDVLQQAGWGRYGPMGRVPTAYFATTQINDETYRQMHVSSSPSWIVRTAGPQAGLQRQIEEVVKSVDPLLPVASFRSLDQIKLRSLAMQRFMAMLLGIAAGLAMLLASIGIYAMISNSVAERTREFGIRLALGATVSQTIRNSAKPGLVCATLGLVIGLIVARWATRFLQGMLYGVTPVDRATYVAVGAGVLVIVAIASLIPALRITKLDPSETLRQE